MNRSTRCRAGCLAVISFLVAGRVRADAPDLLEIYRAAQAGDPVLRSAQASLDVARQRLPEARAALMPTVALVGNLNSTSATTQFSILPDVQRDAGYRSWSLQLTQPLFRAANFIGNRQAEFVVASAEAQFEQARQDFIVRVAQAYFGVVEAADAIAAAESQVDAMTEQLAAVARGLEAGTKSETDLDDTRSRLGSARADRVAAQTAFDDARVELRKITGSPYANVRTLPASMILPAPQPADALAWIDQARTEQPLVRAQRAALEASRLDIERARSEHLPTVDLVAISSHSYTNHSLTTPEDYSTRAAQHQLGFQVNVPLFAGGLAVAHEAEAIGNRDKAEADLETARRQAAADAERAFSGVQLGLAQVDALAAAVRAGRHAVEGNAAAFRAGVRPNLDVLQAQQQLHAAERDLSHARCETLLQGLKLKAAAGILTESDLAALNAMLH